MLVVALIGEGLPGGEVTNLLVLLLNGGVGRDRMRLGSLERECKKEARLATIQN